MSCLDLHDAWQLLAGWERFKSCTTIHNQGIWRHGFCMCEGSVFESSQSFLDAEPDEFYDVNFEELFVCVQNL